MDFNAEGVTQNEKVSFGGMELNFRYRKGDKNGLVIGFDGWDPEANYTKGPSYNKWKMFKSFGYSCLYFSHPTIHGTRISHAMYIGLIKAIGKKNPVFSIIQEARNSSNKPTLLYGRSSGAYAALFYGMCFPRSSCLVVNPEVDTLAHSPEFLEQPVRLIKSILPPNAPFSMTNFSLNNSLLACKKLPNVTLIQNVIDFEYYKNHTEVFVESYNARLLDCNSGCLNVSYTADERGHAYDLSRSEFEFHLSSLLKIKPSSFNSYSKLLDERVLYRKTTTLNTTLKVSVKFFVESEANQALVIYYKSKSRCLTDGFELGLDDMCVMELESKNGVLDKKIEVVLPLDASALYMDVLNRGIKMHDFSVSVIELHHNLLPEA